MYRYIDFFSMTYKTRESLVDNKKQNPKWNVNNLIDLMIKSKD